MIFLAYLMIFLGIMISGLGGSMIRDDPFLGIPVSSLGILVAVLGAYLAVAVA